MRVKGASGYVISKRTGKSYKKVAEVKGNRSRIPREGFRLLNCSMNSDFLTVCIQKDTQFLVEIDKPRGYNENIDKYERSQKSWDLLT